MKRLLLLTLALAAPALAAPRPLPHFIRAEMPRHAVSLGVYHLRFQPGTDTCIVHVWTLPRPASHHKEYFGDLRSEAPVVMDIFSSPVGGRPTIVKSIVYGANSAPSSVSLRFLDAEVRWGFVFQVNDSTTYESQEMERVTETRHRFFVFPNTIGGRRNRPADYKTVIFTSTNYQGFRESYFPTRTSNGKLTITHVTKLAPNDIRTETYDWNGVAFRLRQGKAAPK